MWNLSAHSYSLLRLYRFRDPRLEEHYRSDINKWNAYNTQLHYAAIFVFHLLNCASFYSTTWMSADFWIYLLGCLSGLTFFMNGILNPCGRRNRVNMHTFFCLVNLVVDLGLVCVQPSIFTERTMSDWLPKGCHLQLSGPGYISPPLDATFANLLESLYIRLVVLLNFTMVQLILANLCLAGLNLWSALSYVLILGTVAARVISYGSFQSVYTGLMYSQGILGYMVLAVLLERFQRQKFLAETLLARQMHAGETADNILNHMLKNTLADVAGYIELFLAGSATVESLHDGVTCLRRGMKACRDRQAYLKLVAGTYTPDANAVGLRELGQELLAGRQGRAEVDDLTVLMDRTLITLILDTALSNAAKHGRPGDPDVALTIRRVDAEDPAEPPCEVELQFLVSNAANPLQPPLTPTQTGVLFAPAYTQSLRRVPMISEGIGLACSLVAAQTGGFSLSLSQEDDRVYFRVMATLRLAEPSSLPDPSDSPPLQISSNGEFELNETLATEDPFPPNLHFFIMDDAAMSRRIMEHHIKRYCPSATVHVFGADEGDVELFPALAAEAADIVVVDQHLDYRVTHLGTNVVRRLLLMGYRGLVCVRSSDGTPADLDLYAAAGAHLYIGKDIGGEEMMRRLRTAHQEHQAAAGYSPHLVP